MVFGINTRKNYTSQWANANGQSPESELYRVVTREIDEPIFGLGGKFPIASAPGQTDALGVERMVREN
jgi:hypothetical protein